MVDIAPFRSIRYNPRRFSNLAKVICPPYDVISVPEYHALVSQHPQNIVRIELPTPGGVKERYPQAARLWHRWQSQRVLVEDRIPALFGCEQRFIAGAKRFTRRGFLAALRLEAPGRGAVRPHEQTFAKPKEDRLNLLRALQANVSPIFGVFSDTENLFCKAAARLWSGKPESVTRDEQGVTHRVWRWTDPGLVRLLRRCLREQDVLIADGHHRYETAWVYSREARARDRAPYAGRAYRYVLACLCPMEDPGLVIFPTHRAVRSHRSPDQWRSQVSRNFTVRSCARLNQLLSRLRRSDGGAALGMVLPRGLFILYPKSVQRTGVQKPLPVVLLHQRVLSGVSAQDITYSRDPYEVVSEVQRQEASAAFLLPPPSKAAFARAAMRGVILPQKSTYFYPKLPAGLIMRSLRGNVS